MNRKNPLGSGFLFLLVAGVVGYGIGLGLDLVISGTGRPDFTAPVPSAFTLLFGFTAFFFGVFIAGLRADLYIRCWVRLLADSLLPASAH